MDPSEVVSSDPDTSPSNQHSSSQDIPHIVGTTLSSATSLGAPPGPSTSPAGSSIHEYHVATTSTRYPVTADPASAGNSASGSSLRHDDAKTASTSSAGRPTGESSWGIHAPISHRGAGQVSPLQQKSLEKISRPMSFDKMEILMREMQDAETGVPVRSQKTFLSSIPLAFMGYDLIEWLMDRLATEESEALSIANQLCMHGYFFPTNEYNKSLLVKDDSSLYRFQTPYYFPWQHRTPGNVDYAIFLLKRSLRNKQRHGLEEYESEALASLRQNLKAKWDFVQMQAQEQIRISKDRKKGEKVIFDSQERAYWRIYRPPPAQFTPLEACPIPSRDRQGQPRRRTIDDWQREVDYLRLSMGRTRMNMSQACESLSQYSETFAEYDFFLQNVVPSNPWVTDDITYWQLNHQIVDIPAERRVRRWAISIEELVSDPTGLQEFTAYLKKEYSHENIRFWTAVNDLRRSAASQIITKVRNIYEEFLEPGAPCEINIDGKTMERVQHELRTPSRFTFDAAAEHIYALLLKKDCYPRFIRSEHYKTLLATGIQQPHKKRFFGFGGATKKKTSTTQPAPTVALLSQTHTSGPPPGALTRRRGSDRSLSGSAHELAVLGVRNDTGSKVSHSHSQSNLSDIPYSMVYRGDMPSTGFPILSGSQEDPASIINSACQTTTVTGAAVVVVSGSSTVAAVVQNPSNCDSRPPAPVDSTREPTAALDVSTAANNSSSVCPWDDPPESEPPATVQSRVRVSVCAPDATNSPAVVKRSATKARNHSAVDASGTDINEVSDRMRRSCGIRQSTIDCEMVGAKRLEPIGKELRRSSMSVTPRLPDPNWSLIQQHQCASIDTADITIQPNAQELPSADPCSAGHSSAPPVDQHPAIMTTVISEEQSPIHSESGQNVDETQHPDDVHSVGQSQSAVRRPNELDVMESSQVESAPCVVTFSVTPTITVDCPIGDASAGQSYEPVPVDTNSPTRQEITVPGSDPNDAIYALEELSPTTEEYQECCAPDDYQLEGEILAPGCVAPAPTPAPSIAPLAEVEGDPADDDPELDDPAPPADEVATGIATVPMEQSSADPDVPAQTPSKRTHRKKRSPDGQPPAGETGHPTSEEIAGPNMVCPWDDEDVSATTDAPFVKTYATLGYL